ncbi:hypothetical protein AAGU66_17895 (plasmid) [Edwardsiella ictaluri]|uniref:hypothetical protein n=1 Tax=Edwardsiella ictaluri TaxID=67780 RepID=UPI0018DDF22D|nr:hypothetical protein [Edwardsiella ictaluri]HAV7788742.1 hypothetical protein [Escherichia coli]QPW28572.1 hypothetical protein F8538_17760 [Edwardsiella ictaluri]HAV7789537.1 hypothetical protein [Escherichia coli]HBB2928413.1 hypothetical protein [Escherichia coli]HBB4140481.1 hypothetical protein [Escherichia coli]
MINLNFRSAIDFEEFCCYWMTDIIKKGKGDRVRFVRYGSSGQAQSGVDIISSPIDKMPAVAQCKCYSRPFTLADLKSELEKTDNYPHPIKYYFLLTTANPHTSIQNAMPAGYLTHTRSDGTSFNVYIRYWSELEDINFLPQSAWQRYFPEVQFTPVIHQEPNAMEKQFALLKQLLEEKLPVAHLDWLEKWDFSSGYMNSTDFEPFHELVYEYNLVKSSFDNRDYLFLDTPLRLKIYQCLPAGNGFFQALVAFRDSVSSHIIGASINGRESLSVLDLPNRHKITRQWISNAEYLAKKYRDIVF